MKVKAALVLVGVLVLGLAGCRTPVPGAEEVTWGRFVFTAEATSIVAKEEDPVSLLEAQAAAATMAKANLLALIKGAEVSSEVTVGDLMFESQQASEHVDGFLARATISYAEDCPLPGTVTACARLELSRRELKRLGEYVE